MCSSQCCPCFRLEKNSPSPNHLKVLTLDSWNLQVNQSVSSHYGQIWSCFFIFFIIFMFFYFINLLLGAFVSYYSNPNLRMNFDYDYGHDDILNPELNEEFK